MASPASPAGAEQGLPRVRVSNPLRVEDLNLLDEALADWAEAYGDQTLKDHAALARAIESGRVKAVHGL